LRDLLTLLLNFGLALQLTACTGSETTSSSTSLRVGILPDGSADALRERHTPLYEFLSRETGLAYELIIP
jgi:ABC-type phosphate/phosphonate transport system substrate-binding protein